MEHEDSPRTSSHLTRALRTTLQANADAEHALAVTLGIGHTDLSALDYLASSSGDVGTVELAHRLGMRSASATVLVDRLERAGHLVREPHPDDRRRVTLGVTDSARRELRQALAPLTRAIDDAAARMTPGESEAASRFLTDVAEALRAFAGR